MSSIEKDNSSQVVKTPTNVTLGYQYPYAFEPEFRGNGLEGTQKVFPKPRHRAIDAIASSLILWSPFVLEKLLDLSIPQFYLAMMSKPGGQRYHG